MPTIEIISVNSSSLDLNQEELQVSIIKENKLESHRSLFFDYLLKQNGTIIHIGNPDLKTDSSGGYFAGQIIDWAFEDSELDNRRTGLKSNETNNYANQDFIFQFRQEFKNDINLILQRAIVNSPDKTIYFLTDYQFGPEKEKFKSVDNLSSFWLEHDNRGLNWNTLYLIKEK